MKMFNAVQNIKIEGINTILMNFPESHMIMFFENVFLILSGFYQYPKSERIQLPR